MKTVQSDGSTETPAGMSAAEMARMFDEDFKNDLTRAIDRGSVAGVLAVIAIELSSIRSSVNQRRDGGAYLAGRKMGQRLMRPFVDLLKQDDFARGVLEGALSEWDRIR